MPYTHTMPNGKTYFLNAKRNATNTGFLYYFSKEETDFTLDALPEGYEVKEGRTPIPYLKRTINA